MSCFGNGRFTTPVAVAGVFKRVAVASESACGIRDDGTIACSPSRQWTAAQIPKGRFTEISCGIYDCCALDTAGMATCWGEDGPLRKPPSTPLIAIDLATSELACGLDRSQSLVCWGILEPARRKPPPGRFESVSTSAQESCATAADGTVTCWGDSHPKPITLTTKLDPKIAPRRSCGVGPTGELVCWGPDWFGPIPEGPFRALDGGQGSMCGIRASGELACFGPTEGIVRAVPSGTFTAVSVGSWHACARRTEGAIACWGSDFEHSLSAPGGTFRAVTADVASCVLAEDGTATCWGKQASKAPKEKLLTISSGGAFTCGVTKAGALTCFDADQFLADRSHEPLPKGDDFVDVVSGYEHVCALRKSGAVVCWGRDVWGETKPPEGTRPASLALGEKRTCALTPDGRALCWGGTPNKPPPGPFRAIAITGNTAQDDPTFVCAIRSADQTLECWPY
jgi:Regulator of chromosome condensation (RCC1) repeat